MSDSWQNGRRNGGNAGKQRKEHRHNATLLEGSVEVDHLSFPFIIQARMPAPSEAVLPKSCETLATLMTPM
jgi:hypothetical protein